MYELNNKDLTIFFIKAYHFIFLIDILAMHLATAMKL